MHRFPAILLPVLAIAMFSCSQTKEQEDFVVNGSWLLDYMVVQGHRVDYPQDNAGWLRIYDDSCLYECQLITAPTGTMVIAGKTERYTLVRKNRDEYVYLQGGTVYPFVMKSDTTIMIQESGVQRTWNRTVEFDGQRLKDIANIIRNENNDGADYSRRYVFSNAERDLQTSNHTLSYVLVLLIFVLLMVSSFLHNIYDRKKRVEQELRQIEQERKTLPAPVREALNTVEEEFRKSDFYIRIRKKIDNGECLAKDDWHAIEEKFKSVYPRFTTTLLTLCNMSAVEFRVCLLLKLNVTPSEMANVLCKDKSSISSIRSRLYTKFFGKKGSSRDWDDFIRSL
ncbi:MAG: hypothetical protein K2J00_04510 [Bacteroidaceae bacterium]|nr:hypothetical protein [Bacteroidaceae bacterium]